ncbi:unnamed protein product, partial [marine sediment metagenome]
QGPGTGAPRQTKGATTDYYKQVVDSVGDLKCAIDRLERNSPSSRHQTAIRAANQVEEIIDQWKAEA